MSPRSGYTLPVFACAAAIAALDCLENSPPPSQVAFHLIQPDQWVTIPIEQAARLSDQEALAITRSDPGENLDLTRHTPIWARVERRSSAQGDPVVLVGGEGIGRRTPQDSSQTEAAIYGYAQQLITQTLSQRLEKGQYIRVTVILPEGRALARRTSNEAFGIVEGLSLLGTSGLSQPLSAPDQLRNFQTDLVQKAQQGKPLVLCIGENGLNLALSLGISPNLCVKSANWLGPLLVLAGEQHVPALLLLGYHGKLIKLAGGIFHTHHHLADGRQEILAAIAASQGLGQREVTRLLDAETVEAGLNYLKTIPPAGLESWADRIYQEITRRIEARSQRYIEIHSSHCLPVGCLLFNRARQIFTQGPQGQQILGKILSGMG
ncbi:cobalt-precorrin-5B (C(1))-methyltransferase CbiD [Lyngbya confervoides]|uniref:Cobalt-precorrin-5B C(1)-methyltransferase n=1 Tax=Lyngbya confervoides BDU141951 TaxID=1574623 RepID=A0ABD4T8Q7_9CYAN|nr:cobalt-precorrin-5B (C(1))-methyltransferase CbiD [Lyngbya confervoides]MCM1985172.1 cobalt-precorrin-5B (C(1))-methyltransferase CbiD [Lyngbya confervoides BDU141951]